MIQNIQLNDYDDKFAPPERVLNVALVGDIVHLTFGKYEETDKGRSLSDEAVVGVPASDLINAIKALAVSQERHDLERILGTDRDIRMRLT